MSKITLDNLSDNLKVYLEGLGLSEEQVLNLINENGLDEEELKAMLKDTMSINELNTNSKTVIGAINELFQSANNGKELIANAIGEPLNAGDTFSAMSNDINSLLSTFKINMMNNGIAVESGDRFKSLIDKITTMVEEGSGKGIKYANGSIDNIKLPAYTSGFKQYSINLNIDFTPSILMINIGKFIIETTSTYYTANTTINSLIHNSSSNAVVIISSTETGMGVGYAYISSSNQLYMSNLRYERSVDLENITYYAIGVGEEDTTLRDSLASILTEEGVSVTEEDDMASLISKVDSEFTKDNNTINNLTNELAGKVTPAGTAVASDVLSGKTFINSTGELITGTNISYTFSNDTNSNFMYLVCSRLSDVQISMWRGGTNTLYKFTAPFSGTICFSLYGATYTSGNYGPYFYIYDATTDKLLTDEYHIFSDSAPNPAIRCVTANVTKGHSIELYAAPQGGATVHIFYYYGFQVHYPMS